MKLVDAAIVLEVEDELHYLSADLSVIDVVAQSGDQFAYDFLLQFFLFVLFERQEAS